MFVSWLMTLYGYYSTTARDFTARFSRFTSGTGLCIYPYYTFITPHIIAMPASIFVSVERHSSLPQFLPRGSWMVALCACALQVRELFGSICRPPQMSHRQSADGNALFYLPRNLPASSRVECQGKQDISIANVVLENSFLTYRKEYRAFAYLPSISFYQMSRNLAPNSYSLKTRTEG